MRKGIITGAVVLIGLIILTALNVNFLIERNKDYLLGRLARTLGHPVTADTIAITYTPLAMRLVNLAIAGEPNDPANPMVVAKALRIEPRILPMLLGQLRANQITLDSPVITIIRDAHGRYNYEPPPRNTTKSAQSAASRNEKTAKDRPAVLIPPVQIVNGTLRYRDLKNDGELIVAQIQLTVSGDDADEPVDIQFAAAIMSAIPNLKFQSRIGPIAGIGDYRDIPIDGSLDAQRLDLGKVNRALPQLRKALPKHLRFDGIYDIKDLKFKGTLHKPSLKGAVSGTDASFRFE